MKIILFPKSYSETLMTSHFLKLSIDPMFSIIFNFSFLNDTQTLLKMNDFYVDSIMAME